MQLSINFFDAPPLTQARAAGEAGMALATERAERDVPSFRTLAEAAILAHLAKGPSSGEDCTDAVRAAGVPFADGRALGSVYSSLAKRGLIRQTGTCPRRRGHGTAGGRIYALSQA